MSEVSTLYAAMVTRLTGIFAPAAGWVRLPEPDDLEENPENKLKKGWGLKLGAATPGNGSMTSCFHLRRIFTVVLTRECFKQENDAAGKGDVDLLLMEDVRTLIKDFETGQSLNNGTSGLCTYVSDNGVTTIRNGDQSYKAAEVNFSVLILENLNL